jgi:hypothetical protein
MACPGYRTAALNTPYKLNLNVTSPSVGILFVDQIMVGKSAS